MVDDIRILTTLSSVNETGANGNVSCYVNSSDKILWIKSGNSPVREVMIYDLAGRPVYRSHRLPDNNSFNLSVAGYESGIYLVCVRTSQGRETFKITVN